MALLESFDYNFFKAVISFVVLLIKTDLSMCSHRKHVEILSLIDKPLPNVSNLYAVVTKIICIIGVGQFQGVHCDENPGKRTSC